MKSEKRIEVSEEEVLKEQMKTKSGKFVELDRIVVLPYDGE